MNVGIIEGFYGEDWGWPTRMAYLDFMADRGLKFFIYAPKGDAYLRSRWTECHSAETMDAMASFGEACRNRGIAFGIGLTPLSLHETWDADGRKTLSERIDAFKPLHLDILAILFDDMRGDMPHLANTQADMVKTVVDSGAAKRHIMCPTYYCDPGILDRLFGERPKDYLKDLGTALDQGVDVFWTGPKVLSTTYPDAHLDAIGQLLGRKPFIWDNYPVNDGPRMSRHLHLRAPHRPASILQGVSGLAINPMIQPYLSQIPIDAMSRSLSGHDDGDATQATLRALEHNLPADLAASLKRDWQSFQDAGLDELQEHTKKAALTYAQINHPAAQEIARWLKGEYIVSADILTDE